MSARPECGIAIPQIATRHAVDCGLVRDVVTRAEALSLHSLWVQEQMLGAAPVLGAVELLTYAAGLTRRVRLGTATLLSVLRSPVHLAKSLATLDRLSDGRLIVGVALGAGQARYPAYGIAAETRVARFVEGLEVMRRLWSEPEVTLDGRFFVLDRAPMEPKPAQRPHPPLWFGGHHREAIRRAVQLGDGFIGAGSSSLAEFRDEVAALRGLLEEAGRDPASFPVSKRVYVAVDDDRARAARGLAEWFAAYYRNPTLGEQVAVCGGPQECIDGLATIARSGAGLLILTPVFAQREQLERLAAEVIPAL